MRSNKAMRPAVRFVARITMLACIVTAGAHITRGADAPRGEVVALVATDATAANNADAGNVEIRAVELEQSATSQFGVRRGLRIRTLRPLRNFWDAQIVGATTAEVHRGQPGLLSFWARTVDVPGNTAAEGRVAAYFQRAGEPWDKSFLIKRGIPRRWTLFQIPFRVHESFQASEAQICLGFGFEPQEVEVAAVSVEVYSSAVELDSLPSTPEHEPLEAPLP